MGSPAGKSSDLSLITEAQRALFWSRVERGESCWTWMGSRTSKGYGRVEFNGHRWRTHRLALGLRNGAIADNLLTLHRCDNTGCVNPKHLYEGTAEDNVRDMIERGRKAVIPQPRLAKLTIDQVRYLRSERAKGRSYEELAKELGVSKSTICSANNGRTWSHVKDA